MLLLIRNASIANIRIIVVSEPQASLEKLKKVLQLTLELKEGFSFKYEDPEFWNLQCD